MPQSIKERDKELNQIVKENKMAFVPFISRIGDEETGVFVHMRDQDLGKISVSAKTGEFLSNIPDTGSNIDKTFEHIRVYLKFERNAYVGASPTYVEKHNGDRALYVLYDADNDN